ncbi:SRPBCC family protein [Mycetocola zhujimingii]|uniref:SRPBCC family protein n=1 Tax=Mycetocola zhujimingii TaxID=2079792 RepID=UPI000D375B16|nr:SRPBCC family protein [Mycetocola zhujimingii]AWB87705.1 polyketide cyclase [Mycetocola zhujimingii]
MTNPTTITVPDGVPFIEIVREFDAPLEAVYRAHIERELVMQWLGPRGYVMDIERWDIQAGGGYRYAHRVDGDAYWFNGVVHSASPEKGIVQTFEYEGFPGAISLEFLNFEDVGNGRTRVTGHSVYPRLENRDGMVESGMDKGVTEGYEQLDELLATSISA